MKEEPSMGPNSPDENRRRGTEEDPRVRGIEDDNAVEAALQAAEQMRQQREARQRAAEMELEQARYEARRYEAVDPEQRLVAAELESRWNAALQKVRDLEKKLQTLASDPQTVAIPSKEVLLSLAQDLPAVWNAPSTDMRLKQRIVHILIREIVVDIDEEKHEVVMLLHWAGGRHSELRIKKNAPGHRRNCTNLEAVEVVRRMNGQFSDEQIASMLNRLGMRTGAGNTWNEARVYSLRHHHQLPDYDATRSPAVTLTLDQAAGRLGISVTAVRRLIHSKAIPATQVVPGAPWQIPAAAVESPEALQAAMNIKNRHRPRPQFHDEGTLKLIGFELLEEEGVQKLRLKNLGKIASTPFRTHCPRTGLMILKSQYSQQVSEVKYNVTRSLGTNTT